jgi:hypothetical protein
LIEAPVSCRASQKRASTTALQRHHMLRFG